MQNLLNTIIISAVDVDVSDSVFSSRGTFLFWAHQLLFDNQMVNVKNILVERINVILK